MEKKNKKLSTASGKPNVENENTMSAEEKDSSLSKDVIHHEKGTGAYGTFTVTEDIEKYTKAKLFNKILKQTKIFVRFSSVNGENGSTETERDPHGFAVKFYTEDGNWDLVGNNTPVSFVKDPKKIPYFIQTQKIDPHTNCKCPTMMWDYWSLNPESLHQVMISMSDRGTPQSYRHMNGYGSHTYSMINEKNKKVWVKFHFKTMQGIKNFTNNEAKKCKDKDPRFAQQDLIDAIDKKDFPKWTLKIQVMEDEQAKKFMFNPFDITKIWPQKHYPLISVGVLELNEIPKNYFADEEQSNFTPARVVDGISYSPDKILQGYLLSYPDTKRYSDDLMLVNTTKEVSVTYYANSINKKYKEPPMDLENNASDWYDRNAEGSNDHFTQPRWLYNKAMNDNDRQNLISNLVFAMNAINGEKRDVIINRQLCHFFNADMQFGMAVAKGLGVNVDSVIKDFKYNLMHAKA